MGGDAGSVGICVWIFWLFGIGLWILLSVCVWIFEMIVFVFGYYWAFGVWILEMNVCVAFVFGYLCRVCGTGV